MIKLLSALILLLISPMSWAQQGGGGPPGGVSHAVQVKTSQNTFGGLALGTSGWVLTSNGASADPSFQAAGGGGGTPGGSTTQVQFNLAGSFAGDAGLTYIGSTTQSLTLGDATTAPSIRTQANTNNSLSIKPGTVTTGATSNGKINITGADVGTATTLMTRPNITITAGAVTTSGAAGNINIIGGAATSGAGGSSGLLGGSGTTGGGGINLTGGSASAGVGGGLTFATGTSTEANGAAITITSGSANTAAATSHDGGAITVSTGVKSSSGTNGSIIFSPGGVSKLTINGVGAILDSTGSAGTSGQALTTQGAASGAIWATAGGATAYGKVSVSLGGPCSISGSVSSSHLFSCSYTSTGHVVVTFNLSTFANVVPCIVTPSSAIATPIFAMVVEGATLNQVEVVTYASPSTLTDLNFELFCTGT